MGGCPTSSSRSTTRGGIAVRAQLLDAPRPDDLLEVVRHGSPSCSSSPPRTSHRPPTSCSGAAWATATGPSTSTRALEVENTLFELNLYASADGGPRPLHARRWHGPPKYEKTRIWLDDNQEFRQDVLDLLEAEGPMTAQEIPDTSIVSWPSSGWNNNRNAMMMLEILMARGQVAVAGRRGRDRLWDRADRVYHADIPTVPLEEAKRERSAERLRAFGIMPAKTTDLPVETTRVNGDLGVAGDDRGRERERGGSMKRHWMRWAATSRAAPRSSPPIDGLVRDRKRMVDLLGFDYTLEMYKPKAKRRWGYWAMPILHGERLVGQGRRAVRPRPRRAAGRRDPRGRAVHARRSGMACKPSSRTSLAGRGCVCD